MLSQATCKLISLLGGLMLPLVADSIGGLSRSQLNISELLHSKHHRHSTMYGHGAAEEPVEGAGGGGGR